MGGTKGGSSVSGPSFKVGETALIRCPMHFSTGLLLLFCDIVSNTFMHVGESVSSISTGAKSVFLF